MTIPGFIDRHLPPGRHIATVDEVDLYLVEPFPDSMTRRRLFASWKERRRRIAALISIDAEWVNGSFVTTKRDPGDIDVVLFVLREDYEAMSVADRKALDALAMGQKAKDDWGCDSYLMPIPAITHEAIGGGNPDQQVYWNMRGYWESAWSHDRALGEKGYLEVRGP